MTEHIEDPEGRPIKVGTRLRVWLDDGTTLNGDVVLISSSDAEWEGGERGWKAIHPIITVRTSAGGVLLQATVAVHVYDDRVDAKYVLEDAQVLDS